VDFSYIGLVNRVLMMCKQTRITAISTTVNSDAYRVQLCLQDTLADLSNLLRIKIRLINFTITTVNGTRTYSIPHNIAPPFVSLRQKDTDIKLVQMATEEYDMYMADPDDSSGPPERYYIDGYSGVETQPASAGEVVYSVSSSPSDSGQLVIQGYDTNDRYQSEVVSLNGTTAVASSNTYKHIESISKVNTSGAVTFRNNGSTTTFLVLKPHENSVRLMKIGLHPIPDDAITLYGRGYVQSQELYNKYDVPIGFGNIHVNAIVSGTYWRYMRFDSKYSSGSIAEAKADYIGEVQKITAMDQRDPDIFHRIKSTGELRYFPRFRPLNRNSY